MAQLPISGNVITISVSQSNPGVGNYNTSNLALFTDDQPLAATQTIVFGGTAASGAFTLKFGGVATASISWNATLATIQADIIAVTGMTNVSVTGSIASGSLVLTQPGSYGAIPLAVVSANTLQTAGSVAVSVTPTNTSLGWSGGSAGYSNYLTPTQVGVDFGSTSKTFLMANSVFSQQPNILTGGGQLIVILLQTSIQNLAFSAVAASGAFEITYNSNTSASIAATSTPAQIQAIVQAVPGLSQAQVTGTIANQSLNILLFGVYGAGLSIGTTANTLLTAGSASITITQSVATAGETIGAAVTRTSGTVQYFGILVNESVGTSQVIPSADVTAAAAIVQALVKIIFFVTNSSTDLTASSGLVATIASSSDTQTRMLYYGDTSASGVSNALVMSAAYAGLGLSVNFNGSNTTTTMHLKVLTGVAPDPSMTQALLSGTNGAATVGADTYISLQGVSAVFCSGVNQYYDQVYNLLWFTGALQVAGFNYLAQTGTKIPQTEAGMTGLKGAYRAVCQQAVTNQYLAPGAWNSATTFGNQASLVANVSQVGYYIYSGPVAAQSQANRVARQAPLVQIAAKQAGAIQSSTVIVTINP